MAWTLGRKPDATPRFQRRYSNDLGSLLVSFRVHRLEIDAGMVTQKERSRRAYERRYKRLGLKPKRQHRPVDPLWILRCDTRVGSGPLGPNKTGNLVA